MDDQQTPPVDAPSSAPAGQATIARSDQQVATTKPATPPAAIARNGEIMPPKRSRRSFILPLVILAALGFGAVKGYNWFVAGRFIVSTDDAYVKADITTVSAKVSGYVLAVPAIENQRVHKGDALASIDAGDYQLAIDAAQKKIDTQDATIARIGQQGDAQKAVIAQAQAQLAAATGQLAAAKADQLRTQSEYVRAQQLMQSHFGTQQRIEQALADRDRAAATVASTISSGTALAAAVDAAKANLAVADAQRTEAVRVRSELQVTLDKAKRDLSFTKVTAPVGGIVANRAVEVGQYVQPGQRLLALIPPGSVYIEANFKETQIADLKPGQKVMLSVDSIGGKDIEGTLVSMAPASGSEYSLLPPDNATGNFTKIVQRVPVRIRVPSAVADSGMLRPGLSVVANVYTRDESKPAPTLMGALGLSRDGK